MPQKPTFRQRVQYLTDNVMSKGPGAMIAFLAILSIVIIVLVSLVVRLANWDVQPDGSHLGFIQLTGQQYHPRRVAIEAAQPAHGLPGGEQV